MTVEEMKEFLNKIKKDTTEIALVIKDEDKDCIVAITHIEHDTDLNVIKLVPNSRVSIK